ncbi:hypothetical protein DENSPDRAFT_832218 [Dentipellis sp. KUC8613]|nr:hypothetical protein DENSPDRAFT_832218 [Dentipellis sp. KUC8613]
MVTTSPLSNVPVPTPPLAYREPRYTESASARHFLGPMPVAEFLEEFLPKASTPCTFEGNPFDLAKVNCGTQFINAVARASLSPDLELFDTADTPDEVFTYVRKPDISVISKRPRNPELAATANAPSTSPPSTPLDGEVSDAQVSTDTARANWSNIELFIARVLRKDDPFTDPGTTDNRLQWRFEVRTKRALKARARMSLFAGAQFAVQFRCFCFSICFIGDCEARLLRWDRGGAIVSERFDFVKDPDMLKEFLWRFNHLNMESRGWDTSVTLATAEEAAMDREMFPPGIVVHKVHVKDDADHKDHFFLVSKPADYGLVACDKATKCYIALDMETKERVWLKDSWRMDLPDMQKEYKIYEKLRTHRVSNVPGYYCGGDIAQQRTASVDFEYKPWRCGRHALTPHRHYRLVLQVIIGRRLREYQCTKELCGAIRDALIALGEAHERAGVLHQDISGENIMITAQGKGILIDWDMARDTSYKAPDEFQRTGTWRFMSVNLISLDYGKTAHGLRDDTESALWVLLYCVTRFLPAVMAKLRKPKIALHTIFDTCDVKPDGRTHGGSRKLSYIVTGYFIRQTILEDTLPPPLFDLLQKMRHLYYVVYADFSYGAMEYARACQKRTLESLESVDAIVNMFNEALDKEGWPEDDKGIDTVYPVNSDTESDDEEADTRKRSRDESSQGSNSRRRESESSKVRGVKRQRVD